MQWISSHSLSLFSFPFLLTIALHLVPLLLSEYWEWYKLGNDIDSYLRKLYLCILFPEKKCIQFKYTCAVDNCLTILYQLKQKMLEIQWKLYWLWLGNEKETINYLSHGFFLTVLLQQEKLTLKLFTWFSKYIHKFQVTLNTILHDFFFFAVKNDFFCRNNMTVMNWTYSMVIIN